MNGPTILTFNLAPSSIDGLDALCASLGLTHRPVSPEACGQPLGALVGTPVSRPAPGGLFPFAEPMLVMCGLDEETFNRFLAALRASGLPPIPLKAVLTPTNFTWNPIQLHDELLREHIEMQRLRNRPK